MTQVYLQTIIRFIISCILVISFIQCGSKESNSTNLPSNFPNDSISVLLDNSNDPKLSQEEQREWLEKAYSEVIDRPDDSLKTEYLSKISLAYLKRKDSLNFRKTNRQTMELSIKLVDSVNLAESHWDIAAFFRSYSIPDSSYYHYGEANKIYNSLNNDLFSGRMLYNMATIQSSINDYIGSEINTIKAIELLKPLNADRYLNYCYNNLAIVSKDLGEYERAFEYYTESLNYAENVETSGKLLKAYQNNIGNLYREQGKYEEAIKYFELALTGDESIVTNDPEDFARTLNNLADSRYKLLDTVGVEDQLNQAFQIRDSINDYGGLSSSHYTLAGYYLFKRDTVLALENAEKAIFYSKSSDNNDRLLKTYKLLPRIDPDNATKYAGAYIRLNDSLQMAERRIRDKFARIQFETDEFIEQNRLLAQQRQMWIGIAAGLLLLAISIFIIIYQRTKNQKLEFERQQQEANQEIFDLMLSTSQKVEEGKHDEQKRISEELHDGVLGQMNGIRMVLLGLNKKTDEGSIGMRSEAIDKLQNVQEEIRTISHELSDAAYQKFHNFIISIRDLVQSVSEASQIEAEFTYDHDTTWDELSGEIKINLYRVVQEGLQNCVKYSKAKVIKLNFGADDSELRITLEDDGVGFDSRKVKKGIGHKNINSRMGKIGGSWEVISAPGKGTKLNINVPYRWIKKEQQLEEDPVLEKETLD